MNVLHIIPRLSFRCGGPVKAVLGMASAQVKSGLNVRILTTDHWYQGHAEIPNCEIKVCKAPLGFWQWSPSLNRMMDDEVKWADIVNIHTLWSYTTMSASRSCLAAGVPYILRPCGMLDEWSLAQKPWKKKAYSLLVENNTVNNAGALWFSSEEERLSSKGFHYSSPAFVIPLGVTLTEYEQLPQQGAFRHQFLGSTRDRLLLFLGRITPVKQLDLLVRAFAEIVGEYSDVRLVIAGPDEDGLQTKITDLAQALGIANKINFPGGLEKEQVVAALCDADVFVLPSLHENFGVAAIEAMAAGTPVIVTETVGLARFVHDAGAGIVVDSDINNLVWAIKELLNNPSAAEAMGQRGRSMALDRFTWGTLIPEITTAYEDVIRNNQTGAARTAVS